MTDVTPDQSAATASTPEPPDTVEPAKAPASPDTRRLVIALVLLGLVAVTAVGFGIVRKKSSTETTTTPTSAAGPTTTAKGGATPTTAAGGATNPACPNWAKSVYTKPGLKDPGVYLYNDTKFHLRVIHPGEASDYSGTITAANDLDAKAFKLTAPAAGTLEVKGNTATFVIHGAEAAAGIDFSIPCQSAQFSIAVSTADGQPLPVDQFIIGKDGKAISNPMIFSRT